ncbi:MAG: hypothetical protein Q3982_05560 [Phoenicibacter congonensis]|uniref:Uncharacterized protein n=1 Tax=Phoenicibacter congonensis TaxID=1944646 RepID=A0AA43UAB9_9ACTN|nr:hypothetical protein [Phoenicibacter congonensis]
MRKRLYQIQLKSPLGERKGTLLLCDSEGYIEGQLCLLEKATKVTGTLSESGQVALAGELKTLLDSIRYSATGSIDGRKLLLNLKTDFGEVFPVIGEEMPVEE